MRLPLLSVTALAGFALMLTPNAVSAEGGNGVSLTVPEEVTPEIVAIRGCIEGVAHPSGAELSRSERFAACDDYVGLAIGEDAIRARYARALQRLEDGESRRDFEQAHRDFSFVIEAGWDGAVPYSRRAWISVRYLNDVQAALNDIEIALSRRPDPPRDALARGALARDLERRAYILLALTETTHDPSLVYRAQDDLAQAEELAPYSAFAQQLDAAAARILHLIADQNGQAIEGG